MKNKTQIFNNPSPQLAPPPNRPLIVPGEYQGTINAWKVLPPTFGKSKLAIQIEIRHASEDIKLTCFFNIDMNEDGTIAHPPMASKLGKTLRKFFPTTPAQHFNLDQFIEKNVNAMVVTSNLNAHKQLKHESDHFSIIESFTPLENHNPEVIDASEQEPYSNSDEDEGLPF